MPIGLMIHLGDKINAGAGYMQKVVSRFIKNDKSELSEEEFMATLVTIIVLFCASGTGIYASICRMGELGITFGIIKEYP